MEKLKINKKKFKEIALNYEAFLIDAYGVFWLSSERGVLEEAKEAMRTLVLQGKQIGILSNSTQLHFNKKLEFQGLYESIHYHFVLTSGMVTRSLLKEGRLPFATPRHTYILLGEDHPRFESHCSLFVETPYQLTNSLKEADFIYLPVPHIQGYDVSEIERFKQLIQSIKHEPKAVLCANPDLFAHEGASHRLVVRQGSIAKLLQEQGFPVYYIGKPFPIVYEEALRLFSKPYQRSQILMIGDTPQTDVRGAKKIGISSALVTETGVMSEKIHRSSLEQVIAELTEEDTPDFLIDRLCL